MSLTRKNVIRQCTLSQRPHNDYSNNRQLGLLPS
jgi:hypothetical protein